VEYVNETIKNNLEKKGGEHIGFYKRYETLRPGFPPKKKGGAWQRYGINLIIFMQGRKL
jgi:hypothetical protein